MSETCGPLPAERDHRLESSLLEEIITQHPDRLTQDELVLRMEGGPNGTGRIAILDSLPELKRSGVIRFNGGIVELTFAALQIAEIFEVP